MGGLVRRSPSRRPQTFCWQKWSEVRAANIELGFSKWSLIQTTWLHQCSRSTIHLPVSRSTTTISHTEPSGEPKQAPDDATYLKDADARPEGS
jgi:hypothetical protein